MPILAAYALPHPPLAIPAVGRGQEAGIADTIAAFDEIAREIAALSPETIVFVTPHSIMYSDYFHISPGERATGDMARFGAPGTRFETAYDTALAARIAALAEQGGLPAGPFGEKDAALDHGVTVPMWFIGKHFENYKSVRISQSGLGAREHYRLGQSVAAAASSLGRRAVLVASGDLSHKLKAEGPYGLAPEGAVFDSAVTKAFATGNLAALWEITGELREKAAECGYGSFMALAGCLDGLNVKSRLLSYEGPFGVGYGVAAFSPTGKREDAYRALARQSLEHAVNTGNLLPLPENLPAELTNAKAGTFVSLHKDGRLRGCIGTIAPTTGSVALEIIQNAVSAGLSDPRFPQVTPEELPRLVYKVDVLMPPEEIAGPGELDVKRYGVIVTSGDRRGLLLPDLEGVDTVEEQIDIARQKAGIPEGARLRLERFEVIRHE
jgi:AmmeMemoRadiSam system protein A